VGPARPRRHAGGAPPPREVFSRGRGGAPKRMHTVCVHPPPKIFGAPPLVWGPPRGGDQKNTRGPPGGCQKQQDRRARPPKGAPQMSRGWTPPQIPALVRETPWGSRGHRRFPKEKGLTREGPPPLTGVPRKKVYPSPWRGNSAPWDPPGDPKARGSPQKEVPKVVAAPSNPRNPRCLAPVK